MTETIQQLHTEKIIFWTLSSLILFAALLYMYCVNATVHNVVARQVLENQKTDLTLEIGNKEFQYIALKNAVSLPLAYSLGYSDAKGETYISRQTMNLVSFASTR